MDIGKAVVELRNGNKVARSGWNGKDMYLWLARDFTLTNPVELLPVQDMVMMRTAQNNHVAWLCSQTDLLASDWEIVE